MSLNILIIEDDPLMQLGLRHALGQDSSFSIVGQATDGAAGVQQAMQLNPHLVIMDIGLPHLDGIEATHQIKAACPDTRIVILTSHATEHETALALANGADAYCIKGADIQQVLDAIATVQSGALYLDEKVRHVVQQLQAAPNLRLR